MYLIPSSENFKLSLTRVVTKSKSKFVDTAIATSSCKAFHVLITIILWVYSLPMSFNAFMFTSGFSLPKAPWKAKNANETH